MATQSIAEQVGQRVAQALAVANQTTSGMADRTGIAYSTLRRKLQGRRGEFTPSELMLIAELLRVDVASFLPEEFAASPDRGAA